MGERAAALQTQHARSDAAERKGDARQVLAAIGLAEASHGGILREEPALGQSARIRFSSVPLAQAML